MNLSLHFPESLEPRVRDELELILGEIRGGFFAQHTTSGAHHDVTTNKLTVNGQLWVNETVNSKMGAYGLTINQGSAAVVQAALTIKSSSVGHGLSDVMDGNAYFDITKRNLTKGGAALRGVSTETEGGAMTLHGFLAGTAGATRSTAALAPVMLNGGLISGTAVGSLGADKNVACIRDNGTTRFIFDSDGDSHQDVGTAWTNFHGHDDVALLTSLAAHVTRPDDPIRASFGAWLQTNRTHLERLKLVAFNTETDGRPFVNMSKLTMLLVGAVQQLHARLCALEPPTLELTRS